MALAFTAGIMQTFAAEADAHLDEYGFDVGCLKSPSSESFWCAGFGPHDLPPMHQNLGQLIGFSA
jgi:hypothetical protein